MDIQYDAYLVEQAVFYAVRQDAGLDRELHEQTDPLYDLEDERRRRTRFTQTYLRFFKRLKLDVPLADLLGEFPLIRQGVGRCLVHEAVRRRAVGAELFVKDHDRGPGARTVIIQLLPQSLLNPVLFQPTMRRELWHIEDMLDEAFAYDKESLGGHSPGRNLIRDRYRVLWDVYVEGRLHRRGFRDESFKRELSHRFEKVFARYSACVYPPQFERVFRSSELTHAQLLEWAAHPETWFDQATQSSSSGDPHPGAPCPVCASSTFDWFALNSHSPALIAAVRRDRPDWAPERGICRQCAEIYIGSSTQDHLQGTMP